MTGRELEEYLIGSIVGAEEVAPEEEELEEPTEEEDYGRGPGRRTSLKMFFVRSGVRPEDIESMVLKISGESGKAKKFLSDFRVYTVPKEDNYSVLVLHWRAMERDIVFLIKRYDSYWEILTNERMDHVRRSLSKLLEFSTDIGALWLERNSLDERVRRIVARDSINGFIAKRKTFGARRRVTIRVYGGSDEDLTTARKDFDTEPTTIYFSRHNSPEAAIVGSVAADPGCLFVERVIPEARGVFDEIHQGIREEYRSEYEDRLDLEGLRRMSILENDDGTPAVGIPELRIVSLDFPQSAKWDIEKLESTVREILLDGATKGDSQYIGYGWMGDRSYIVHDGNLGGSVHLRLDDSKRRILLSTTGASKPRLIGDLAEFIMNKVEHSVSISVYKEGAGSEISG